MRFFWWFGFVSPKHWFQLALNLPTTAFILVFIFMFLFIMFVFSVAYMGVHSLPNCDLSLHGTPALTLQEALAFSIETASTIGFGFGTDHGTDAYFNTCPGLLATIYVQIVSFTLINATLVGLLFVRLSRATVKAGHIVFSDLATIRCVDGQFHLSFRVGEVSFWAYHPVLQPKVSAYALLQPPAPPAPPPPPAPPRPSHGENGRTGGGGSAALDEVPPPPVLMPLPGFAAAPRYAEALPPTPLAAAMSTKQARVADSVAEEARGVPQRTYSSAGGNGTMPTSSDGGREPVPFVLEPMAIASSLERRGRNHSGTPTGGLFLGVPQVVTHSIDLDSPLRPKREGRGTGSAESSSVEAAATKAAAAEGAATKAAAAEGAATKAAAAEGADEAGSGPSSAEREQARLLDERARIASYLTGSHVEILVALEAIDPLTGNPFMAQHSYTPDQIVWDHAPHPGMVVRAADGRAAVEWDRFHAVVPVPFNRRLGTPEEAAMAPLELAQHQHQHHQHQHQHHQHHQHQHEESVVRV